MSDIPTNSDDYFDLRDAIERFEELETEKEAVREEKGAADVGWDNRDEFNNLRALLNDLQGNGGDHEWRGAWYPVTLVRDSYWEDFARDEAEQLGLTTEKVQWPYTCIDWKQAARELRMDYAPVDFDGVTYWYR